MKYAPMLAHAAKDEQAILVDPRFVAERKYDGHRGQLCFSPSEGLHLYSRLGNDRIDDAPFLKEIAEDWTETLVLDGELVVPGGTSSDVAGLNNRDRLVYIAFDVLRMGDEEYVPLPYRRRREALESIITQRAHSRLLASEVSRQPSDLLARVKAEGGEGIMMKRLDGVYQPGRRSWNWQKVKVWRTASVIVTGADAAPSQWTVRPGQRGADGVFYPEGKRSSTAEAGFVGLTYGYWQDGQAVPVGSLGVTGPRRKMESYVGQIAEVKHYGMYAKTRALRHPQFLGFRHDKKPEECTYDQE